MRMLITGVKDGKSCVTEVIDRPDQGAFSVAFLDLPLASLPPRPAGQARVADIGVAPGMLKWQSIQFPPNFVAQVPSRPGDVCA